MDDSHIHTGVLSLVFSSSVVAKGYILSSGPNAGCAVMLFSGAQLTSCAEH